MPSLPTVSQKVVADIEQYLAEWKRMENQTARSASSIDRQVDDLTKKIKKKFELADIGKDILKGAGLFGGFEIANKAAELLSDHFRKSAEAAKAIEDSTARQLANTLKIISLHQTDDQRRVTLEAQVERAKREFESAAAQKYETRTTVDDLGRIIDRSQVPRDRSDEENQDLARKAIAYSDLTYELEQANKKKKDFENDTALKESVSDHERRVRALTEGLRNQEKAFDDLISTQDKANDVTEKQRAELTQLAEKYKEMADPLRRFKKELEEIARLKADGKLTPEEATKASDAVKNESVDVALEDFFGDLDKRSQQTKELKDGAAELGYAFQSAFENAVIEGEKFSDVLSGLAHDLEKIWLRKNVTDPLIAGLKSGPNGGILGEIGSLFGFATGGDFTVGGSGGTDSQLVAFKATPGESVSVRTPAQQTDSGGGSSTFIFAPQIAAGVTHQELAGIMPGMFNKFAAMVDERDRRRR